jgi:hypothetical protein
MGRLAPSKQEVARLPVAICGCYAWPSEACPAPCQPSLSLFFVFLHNPLAMQHQRHYAASNVLWRAYVRPQSPNFP